MSSAAEVLADYDVWLDRLALAARTRSAYRRWVRELVEHLDRGDELAAFLSPDGEHDRRAIVGDWRRRLVDRRLAPLRVEQVVQTVGVAVAGAQHAPDALGER